MAKLSKCWIYLKILINLDGQPVGSRSFMCIHVLFAIITNTTNQSINAMCTYNMHSLTSRISKAVLRLEANERRIPPRTRSLVKLQGVDTSYIIPSTEDIFLCDRKSVKQIIDKSKLWQVIVPPICKNSWTTYVLHSQ